MFDIDPASLVLTNGLTCLVMTAMLLVSRFGLGAEARGIRTWALADLSISAGRTVAAASIAGLPYLNDALFPTLTGALALMGTTLHVVALRRVSSASQRIGPALACTAALGLAFWVLLVQTPSLTHRLRWFDAMLACSAIVTLVVLRPLLRFWGARLMAATMALSIAFQSVRFGALLLGVDLELPPEAIHTLRTSVKPGTLVVDLLITSLITGGFVLLQQERLRARIERLVVTDALTGALNRHGLMPQLVRAVAQARRYGRPLSVVMFDLDHFKRINDLHGHATGDQVLAGFAAKVGAQLRGSDALARWGGEEFLLLLPDTPLAGAATLAERLRETIAREGVAGGTPRVTVSGGVACLHGASPAAASAQALLQLLDAADQRLYVAKRQRNCVVADDEPADAAPAPAAAPASANRRVVA